MAILPESEAERFIRLHVALLVYVNRKLGIVPGVDSEVAFRTSSMEDRLKIRDSLHANRQAIDSFVGENPSTIPPDELALVANWKQAVTGTFYVFRFLKRYTVFLSDNDPVKAYGVLGITQEIEDILPQGPPVMVAAALLPWRQQIVHDGLLHIYRVHFGPNIRGSLTETYQQIKATTGIIETLVSRDDRPVIGPTKKRGPSMDELLAALSRVEQDIVGVKIPETPVQRTAFGMLRAAVELAKSAVCEQADADEVVRAGRRLNTALNRLYRALAL